MGYHVRALKEAIRDRGCDPVFFSVAHLAGWVGARPALQVRGGSALRTVGRCSCEQSLPAHWNKSFSEWMRCTGLRILECG